MKNKGNSLYEVLKTASRPGGADAEAAAEIPAASAFSEGGQASLQERLAAYKAAKLAAAGQPSAPEAPPARVSAATLVLEPDPTPVPAPPSVTVIKPAPVAAPPPRPVEPMPAPAPVPAAGPGERVIRLTYNTALFGAMVVVGLLFMTYAIGLYVGKSRAAAESSSAELRAPQPPAAIVPRPLPVAPPTPPPAPPRKEYAIRLGEWRMSVSSERVNGQMLAEDQNLKKALERAGHKGFQKTNTNLGAADDRLVLYVDRFSDLNSEAAKSSLAAMKVFKWNSKTPFAQAALVEVQTSR